MYTSADENAALNAKVVDDACLSILDYEYYSLWACVVAADCVVCISRLLMMFGCRPSMYAIFCVHVSLLIVPCARAGHRRCLFVGP